MARRTTTTTSALDVANYLIARAAKDRRLLDPMTLQKLLYYAQCWSLAEQGKPLFSEPLEAWTWGPVVRVVWKAYSGKRPIMPDDVFYDDLSADQKEVVDGVWLAYGHLSGTALSRLTHKEAPWIDARRGISARERSDRPLDLGQMRKAAEEALASQNAWLTKNWSKVAAFAGGNN